MSRCRSLGVMIDTRLGMYVHTAGPPVDTVVEEDLVLLEMPINFLFNHAPPRTQ
ncbi:hypothetical protein ACTXT7_012533 [Hymenolepis weldensis]